MIFGNIKYSSSYEFLPEKILKCFRFLKENDLEKLSLGSYEIDGKEIFANLIEFTTEKNSTKKFEAHKEFIDIHYIVRGRERIEVAFVDELEIESYKPDIMSLSGSSIGYEDLYSGSFMICYPEDAHRPGLAVNGEERVKKLTFKIKI